MIRPSWAPSLAPPAPSEEEVLDDPAAEVLRRHAARLRARALMITGCACMLLVGLILVAVQPATPKPLHTHSAAAATPGEPHEPHEPAPAALSPLAQQGAVRPRPPVTAKDLTAALGSTLPGATAGSRARTGAATTASADVRLRITTDPVKAELRVDGRPVGNPFDGAVPGDQALQVEVRAPGYRPQTLTVRSDRSRTIGIALQRQ